MSEDKYTICYATNGLSQAGIDQLNDAMQREYNEQLRFYSQGLAMMNEERNFMSREIYWLNYYATNASVWKRKTQYKTLDAVNAKLKLAFAKLTK